MKSSERHERRSTRADDVTPCRAARPPADELAGRSRPDGAAGASWLRMPAVERTRLALRLEPEARESSSRAESARRRSAIGPPSEAEGASACIAGRLAGSLWASKAKRLLGGGERLGLRCRRRAGVGRGRRGGRRSWPGRAADLAGRPDGSRSPSSGRARTKRAARARSERDDSKAGHLARRPA